MRAKLVDENGFLRQAIPGSASGNRQDLPKALFFDHSFWVLRSAAIFDADGQAPWPCMGARILPYETEGCFDVHTPEDLEATARWLEAKGVPRPAF